MLKLNGYTLTGLPSIGAHGDSAGKESLELSATPPSSVMLLSSVTRTNKALPGATIAAGPGNREWHPRDAIRREALN